MKVKFLMRAARRTFSNTVEHEIGKSAAALTYYLLFAMFPILIFINSLLGMLNWNVTAISNVLLPVLPREVVSMLEAYLTYIRGESSSVLLWFSLAFSVWFPLRAVRSLTNDVRLAYQLGKPANPVGYALRQMVFTLVFLVIVTLTLLLCVLGGRFLSAAAGWLKLGQRLRIPASGLNLWQYFRFLLLGALMFLILVLLYTVAQDKRPPIRTLLPGITLSLVSWLVISIGFSVYVENFGKYSIIYGALGTVIVLLIWLYMTSFLLILGAEFNAALAQAGESRRASCNEIQPSVNRIIS